MHRLCHLPKAEKTINISVTYQTYMTGEACHLWRIFSRRVKSIKEYSLPEARQIAALSLGPCLRKVVSIIPGRRKRVSTVPPLPYIIVTYRILSSLVQGGESHDHFPPGIPGFCDCRNPVLRRSCAMPRPRGAQGGKPRGRTSYARREGDEVPA